jgi:hypothetical protein
MRFLLRRIAFYLFTAWAAITLNFFIPRLIPGDPVQSMISRYQGRISADAIHSLRVLFGLDKNQSTWEQYLDYWNQLFHGDLGLSFTFFPAPVSEVIGDSLPWTVGLVGITTIISFLLGTGLGVVAGWRRGSWVDGLLPATTFLSSVPYFWLGLIAIALLAGPGSFFPVLGRLRSRASCPRSTQYFVPSAIQHSLPAGADDSDLVGERLDPEHAQHDGDRRVRRLHHGRPRQGPVRAAGGDRLRGRATRCCPTSPDSRCHWLSSSVAPCSWRSSSPIPVSAISSSRRSARRTTR